MFIVCPCGKKLKVADKLAGKKVRCPGCEEVFIAEEDDGEEKESVVPPKNRVKRPSDEEMSPKQKPLASNKKRNAKPATEDEDDFDDDDEEQPRSSRNKRKPVPVENSSFNLWRNIISSVVLGGLLIGLAVIVWRALNPPGTLSMEINVLDPEVFVDGKKIELTKEDRLGMVSLLLPAGNHEIKVTKDGYPPFLKQITIKGRELEHVDVVMTPERTFQPKGGKQQKEDPTVFRR